MSWTNASASTLRDDHLKFLPREYSSHGFFDLSAVKIDSIFSCIEKKIFIQKPEERIPRQCQGSQYLEKTKAQVNQFRTPIKSLLNALEISWNAIQTLDNPALPTMVKMDSWKLSVNGSAFGTQYEEKERPPRYDIMKPRLLNQFQGHDQSQKSQPRPSQLTSDSWRKTRHNEKTCVKRGNEDHVLNKSFDDSPNVQQHINEESKKSNQKNSARKPMSSPEIWLILWRYKTPGMETLSYILVSPTRSTQRRCPITQGCRNYQCASALNALSNPVRAGCKSFKRYCRLHVQTRLGDRTR